MMMFFVHFRIWVFGKRSRYKYDTFSESIIGVLLQGFSLVVGLVELFPAPLGRKSLALRSSSSVGDAGEDLVRLRPEPPLETPPLLICLSYCLHLVFL